MTQLETPEATPSTEAPLRSKKTIVAATGRAKPPEAVMSRPLATKMARVMAEVCQVPKNGRNSFLDYSYIMESDLVDSLRGKLAEQGVAIFPSILEHAMTSAKDHRGKPQLMATITLELTFVDGDSGDEFSTTWVGQGMDQGDKGYYKAYTGAFKYALMKTFLVTGEDGADEVPAPRRGARAGARR